jgi:DnaJ-class molecular chaperone
MEEDSGADGAGPAAPTDRRNPGDQARPGSKQTGMVPCPECHGSGKQANRPCPNCGGTGEVVQIVGDA